MIDWTMICDATELAARFGVKLSTIHKWRERDIGFPSPRHVLAIGPLWLWTDAEVWGLATGRLGSDDE